MIRLLFFFFSSLLPIAIGFLCWLHFIALCYATDDIDADEQEKMYADK